jgi:hypothetical protein
VFTGKLNFQLFPLNIQFLLKTSTMIVFLFSLKKKLKVSKTSITHFQFFFTETDPNRENEIERKIQDFFQPK